MRLKALLFTLVYCCLYIAQGWAQKDITLEDIWVNYSFYTKSVPGFNFMNDGVHYSRTEEGNIEEYDLTTGKKSRQILDIKSLAKDGVFDGKMDGYTFSDDENKVLITNASESIYRRSSRAFIYLYDFKNKTLQSVAPGKKVMNAAFSPKGDKIAYVQDNDLWYYDIATNKYTQITTDGAKNKIINGASDWVYEEEFSITKCHFWSKEGDKLAYIKFDESEVPEFTMTLYNDDTYPQYETFKYPKVGEKNAVVSAHIYHLKNDKTEHLDMGDMDDMYIPRMTWTTSNDELVVFKMNRHQNHLQLIQFDINKGQSKVLLEEKNKYYINITDDLTFLEDGKHFIWTSEKGGYQQIYLYDMKGKEKLCLTPGNYDVRTFYGVDEKRSLVYYSSAEVSPMESHIYTVQLDGRNKKKITSQSGTNDAQFSSTFDYYVLNHSTAQQAPTYTVYNNDHKSVRVIEDNKRFATHLEDYGINPVEFFQYTTSENVKLNGYMIKPPGFNERRRYPVLLTQYSGPGSQQVLDRWGGNNYWWYQMLAQEGYLVVCVDPRGTGARGEEFMKMTYLELGKYEVMDHIETAKYLGALPYVDENRIGIFGWSYGGHMSSLCILKGNDVFKAAIAVAPVTSWRWYDTIYTERYMRTYAENESGYNDNSPVYFADRLKGNYLLIHGLADDNVHWQHTAEMTAALINANKQFDTYVYPNRNHGIYGGNARIHLYTKMSNFLKEKL